MPLLIGQIIKPTPPLAEKYPCVFDVADGFGWFVGYQGGEAVRVKILETWPTHYIVTNLPEDGTIPFIMKAEPCRPRRMRAPLAPARFPGKG